MNLFLWFVSLVLLPNQFHFVIKPITTIPDANDVIIVELNTLLKAADYSKFTYKPHLDSGFVGAEEKFQSLRINVGLPKLKGKSFLYLEFEDSRTGAKYYSNKIAVYGKDFKLDQLNRISLSLSPTSEVSSSTKSSPPSSTQEATKEAQLTEITQILDKYRLYILAFFGVGVAVGIGVFIYSKYYKKFSIGQKTPMKMSK